MCFEISVFINAIPLFLNNKLIKLNIVSCIVINTPFAVLYILLKPIENTATTNIIIPNKGSAKDLVKSCLYKDIKKIKNNERPNF